MQEGGIILQKKALGFEEPVRLLSIRIMPGPNESNSESGIAPIPLPCCKDDFICIQLVVKIDKDAIRITLPGSKMLTFRRRRALLQGV